MEPLLVFFLSVTYTNFVFNHHQRVKDKTIHCMYSLLNIHSNLLHHMLGQYTLYYMFLYHFHITNYIVEYTYSRIKRQKSEYVTSTNKRSLTNTQIP